MKRRLLSLVVALLVIMGTGCVVQPSVSEQDMDDIRQAIRNDREKMKQIMAWIEVIDAKVQANGGGDKETPPPPPCTECWP